MPKEEIQILETVKQKRQTIPLYQEAFSDPELFVNYYYTEKCKDNFVFVKKKQETVIAMLHLNPYTMIVKGKEYSVFYIVAVATKKEYRHQGHMRDLLSAAFDWMEKRAIPFCFLMPANPAIYEPFGFEKICDFDTNPNRSEREIKQNFTIYCKRDAVYQQRFEQERQLAAMLGEDNSLDRQIIMAAVVNLQEFLKMSGSSISDIPNNKNRIDEEKIKALGWLKKQNIYICEEV